MEFDSKRNNGVSQNNAFVHKAKVHSSGFGGVNNIAQPGGARAYAEGEGVAHIEDLHIDDLFIPSNNLGHEVISIGRPNIINHFGHYLHDEFRSPYASHLYDKPKEFLQEEQDSYIRKMKQIREEWGAWTDIEDTGDRSVPDFRTVPLRDLPNEAFPQDTWQTDPLYVTSFLGEARALITRVTEAIYAEYGYPLKGLSQEEKESVYKKFGVSLGAPPANPEGVAWLTEAGMDGLVRKLLHSMITNDDFYVVMAGHSAAAAHGNNFHQSSILQLQYILEPLFDKLGMRLITRNMAMGGVGTLHFSLAGKSLYGEADFMVWDSGMTESGPTADLFNKQAVLSGARMPILITYKQFDILKETDGKAWVGSIRLKESIANLPETKDEVQVDTLPYATRFLNTVPRLEKEEKYNSICWEDRTDVTPDTKQADHPGSQVGWHPGFRHHRFEGRIYTLIILEGLKRALDKWEEGIQRDGFPLHESYWHVGEAYAGARETLRTYEGDSAPSACEKTFSEFPRICRIAMAGYGMWGPRNMHNDLLDIVKAAPNGYKPFTSQKMLYDSFDLLPLAQKVPDGEIDVHAVAIATTNDAPDLNHDYVDGNNSNTTENRRWLQSLTKQAMKHGLEDIKKSNTNSAIRKPRKLSARKLAEGDGSLSEIVPGRGWEMRTPFSNDAYCDGSTMSFCQRDPKSACLAYGHNDGHASLAGNPMSGWLVTTIPRVKEGIILVRLEWWCNGPNTPFRTTKDWKEVNDGKTMDTTPFDYDAYVERRELSSQHDDNTDRSLAVNFKIEHVMANDFIMDVAINGKIIKSMEKDEWIKYTTELSKNCAVWPILNDEDMAKRNDDWDGEEMELAIRFRSNEKPQQPFCISHIYYA
eukprot:CAMPEP_0194223832 /NCGR_PEP_ID=MMETSP0156-20130528/36041_1 /TAXON_ID=33649 /ORGANISM="Thalassionema nitzschioides, Strain L26-B" /LENGTH=868 /DNA_ID=CAMNT_0038955119 /DNA_START=167 /DNA_END=2773 /DNA_ORIENTATION=-